MAASFSSKYGPWALVTGASKGLGAEFARQCAQRGLNTILVATSGDLLEKEADLLRKQYGVEAKTIVLDLSREDLLDEIVPVTEGLEVGLLVSNAGLSRVRPFLDHSVEELLKQFHVNARAGLILSHYFGRKMAERRRGGIIFLSSASALCGTAYCANYAGTKAYNLILGESLWYELSQYNVDVLGFMPGPTKTPGWDLNEPKSSRFVTVMEVEPTVKDALDSLGRRSTRIAGRSNRFAYFLMNKTMPRSRSICTVSKSMENMFGPFDDPV